MPFSVYTASATFQQAKASGLQMMVMTYIDSFVIATGAVEDHMVTLEKVFACFREARSEMRVTMGDFLKYVIKYLGRVISVARMRPDFTAVEELRDW